MHKKEVVIVRKFWITISALLILLLIPSIEAKAATPSITANKNGTVNVSYDNSGKDTIKVQVVKSGSDRKYTYTFPNKKATEVYACTEGSGAYTISVFKQNSSGKYSSIGAKSFQIKASDNLFLLSYQTVSWENTNAAIKYAKKLTSKSKSDNDKTKKIYKYIVENYSYDYALLKKVNSGEISTYTPNISTVFKNKKGICYDIAALNASMLRSLGIKTKLIKGYSTNTGLKGVYHAWNKVYEKSGKKWFVMDCTYDMQKYKKVDYKAMKKSASLYSTENYQY